MKNKQPSLSEYILPETLFQEHPQAAAELASLIWQNKSQKPNNPILERIFPSVSQGKKQTVWPNPAVVENYKLDQQGQPTGNSIIEAMFSEPMLSKKLSNEDFNLIRKTLGSASYNNFQFTGHSEPRLLYNVANKRFIPGEHPEDLNPNKNEFEDQSLEQKLVRFGMQPEKYSPLFNDTGLKLISGLPYCVSGIGNCTKFVGELTNNIEDRYKTLKHFTPSDSVKVIGNKNVREPYDHPNDRLEAGIQDMEDPYTRYLQNKNRRDILPNSPHQSFQNKPYFSPSSPLHPVPSLPTPQQNLSPIPIYRDNRNWSEYDPYEGLSPTPSPPARIPSPVRMFSPPQHINQPQINQYGSNINRQHQGVPPPAIRQNEDAWNETKNLHREFNQYGYGTILPQQNIDERTHPYRRIQRNRDK
jgi:hypothetical protein